MQEQNSPKNIANSSKIERVIEEFTPDDMELIKKINDEHPLDLEMVVSKNDQGFEFHLGFGDHSPEDIALFLKQIHETDMNTLMQCIFLNISNSIQPEFFERIINSYNKLVEKSQKNKNDQLIIRPHQVFSGQR